MDVYLPGYLEDAYPDKPLDDNYTYAVKEENVPSGYNVSYTDWKDGKETNTGFTSGDTVVITNKQKTNWLKVTKVWQYDEGADTSAQPTEIKVHLIKLIMVKA